jgi:tetraacyldisaccharide 4'-kinase
MSPDLMLICRRMRTFPPALAPVTHIASLAFEALVRIRNRLYSYSLVPRHRLMNPVISIGNITTGGSGKTPLVIYIAQVFLKLGWNPVILSRGYGRRDLSKTWILAPQNSVSSPARILGDEPALMRRHLPSIWMGISRNRFKTGASIAQRQARTIFLLDDGFQHRKLHRDLDVVIIDRTQPLKANRLLPRGTLREPPSGLRRCHVVVINGTPETADSDSIEAEIRSLHAGSAIFHCTQTIGYLIPFHSWLENPPHHILAKTPRSAYLVSALGNPHRFHSDVRQLGIEVRGIRSYRDHYWLKREDWLACANEARNQAADAIITTEKDAVKISHPPDFPLLVSIQSTQISDADAFIRILKDCVGK